LIVHTYINIKYILWDNYQTVGSSIVMMHK
jgi:hypothetical protein